MSGISDNLNRSYSDRLTELGERLQENAGDEELLQEIHSAIRVMLEESGSGATNIRDELQRRFDAGEIRPESFELVQKMLDGIALEQPARPDASTTVDIPLQKTVKMDMSKPLDLPLEPTGNFAAPDANTVALNQTVRIDPPFPLEPPAEAIDESVGDATWSAERKPKSVVDDDQEFINTAVIDDHVPVKRAADEQLQVGSVLRDRFLLQEELTGGSMGVVYKALDRRLAEAGESNPHVAIKVLSSKLSRNANALRALQQEAVKGRLLSHPNIVRYIDLDRDDDLYFVVMEWLEGRSLAHILDDNSSKKMDLEMALNIVSQVSRALDYAHLRGVVHADVKPGNIVITPDGHAKLLDFGVARVRQKQVEGKSKFDPGVLGVASPAYSSMQVLTGEDPVPADDVFSLACLLYRLIAGIRVFGPRNAADAAAQGMEPQRPAGISDAQWRALKKALSYSRVTRFPTPKAFMTAMMSGTDAAKQDLPPVAKTKSTQPAVNTVDESSEFVTDNDTEAEGMALPQPRDDVIRAIRDPQSDSPYLNDVDDLESRRSPWRLALIGAIFIGSAAVVTQTTLIDYVDEVIDSGFAGLSADTAEGNGQLPAERDVEGDPENDIETLPMDDTPDIVPTDFQSDGELPLEGDISIGVEGSAVDKSPVEEAVEEVAIPEFDYSSLLPPTVTLSLAATDGAVAPVALTMRENGAPAVVEITRESGLADALSVRLVESDFGGERSPLGAGQYVLEDNGTVNFVPGQARAQTTIRMSQNDTAETTQQATLQVSRVSEPEIALASLNLTLEDDDEAEAVPDVAANTISLSVEQITVRESDPAVQVNVIRMHPDSSFIDIPFVLIDGTAEEGQDYFSPRFDYISFGPGQESDRVLIPLGQDTVTEPNESFVLEIQVAPENTSADIITRVTVIIQDDDQ